MRDLIRWIATDFPLILADAILSFKRPAHKKAEHDVRQYLRNRFCPKTYRVFYDVTLPYGGGTTQIDHVIVSPFGIFVIEVKNHKGWIFGAERSKVWTQTFYRKKFTFQNPLHQNYKHMQALRSLFELEEAQMVNLVLFTGGAELKTAPIKGVLWSLWDLEPLIRTYQTEVIAMPHVQECKRRLVEARLDPGPKCDARHVTGLKAAQRQYVKPQITEPKAPMIAPQRQNRCGPQCHLCGAHMVERRARKSGKPFLGCATFPDCYARKAIPLKSEALQSA